MKEKEIIDLYQTKSIAEVAKNIKTRFSYSFKNIGKKQYKTTFSL